MEKTIQIWISLHSRSPHRPDVQRDIRRVQEAWRGEDRIWLLPWIKGVARWSREIEIPYKLSSRGRQNVGTPYDFRELAIQSEQFDRIDIGHIDAQRRIFVPGLRLPILAEGGDHVPSQMYRKWSSVKNPGIVKSPGSVQLMVPEFGRKRTVSFKSVAFKEAPGPIMPFSEVNLDTREVNLVWPPQGSMPPAPISVEAENIKHYGKLFFVGDKANRTVRSENDPSANTLLARYVWPQPFDQLFPLGGGHDLLLEREEIRRLVSKGAIESSVNLHAAPYLSEGTATVEKSWFWPRLCTDGATNVLADLFSKHNLDYSDIRHLLKDRKWHGIASQQVPVTRIWGWLGYFWWEFLHDLRSGLKVHRCDHCGAIIGGTARKRFCGKKENPTCYRAVRASAKRAERDRK